MDEPELRKLISRWLDGAIGPDEHRELEAILKENPDARRVYLECMSVHAELCNSATAQEYLQELTGVDAERSHPGSAFPRKDRFAFQKWGFFAISACLLLALGIWQWSVLREQHLAQGDMVANELAILDVVEPISQGCRWYVEQAQRTHAKSYRAGDVVRVTAGKLKLHYTHGTTVVLHSPAAYELISEMKSRMLLGRLTATVSDAGKGFSVLTPQATVIDLGTEFGVSVDNIGATDVVVFKGEVDVDYRNDQANSQRLRMGEAVHLDAEGTASRIVSIDGDAYRSGLPVASSQPAVITKVRDNIKRASLLNYYGIVRGGMGEDVLAYVDRIAHQYNGISEEGMPSYLVGADYVKMFNTDRIKRDIRIDVTLSMPARLYVLFDNRLELPKWLTDEFQDTGDDIGVDTGPFQSTGPHWHNKGDPGVGPGVSVEDELSIWVKEVPKPGVVRLGPVGAAATFGANMYGIAAVPLSSP